MVWWRGPSFPSVLLCPAQQLSMLPAKNLQECGPSSSTFPLFALLHVHTVNPQSHQASVNVPLETWMTYIYMSRQ